MLSRLVLCLSLILGSSFVTTSEAEARKRVRPLVSHTQTSTWDMNVASYSGDSFQSIIQPQRISRAIRAISRNVAMLAHPSGCPRRAFCGCGAAMEVFGSPRRDLWLAANWLKFPRTSPAPGMVAARRGHVFVLKQQNPNGSWLVADYNSGGRQSRLHTRSLAGYTIVNPHG